MKIRNLSEQNSVLHQFMSELRAVDVQTDRMRFRKNIERIGTLLAFEISKSLGYVPNTVLTPLGEKHSFRLAKPVVIASVLRAGIPLHAGLLDVFDQAESGFISAYRAYSEDHGSFEIKVEYQAIPDLNHKILILADPMLATGRSLLACCEKLLEEMKPAELHIAAVIAAPEGIDYLQKHLPENTTLWIGEIDEALNAKNYIVPGLGDAGDLAFGPKL